MHLLHGLLEDTAERYPDREALVFKNERINYQRFNQLANQLARLLISKGAKKGDRIGVYFEKSIEQAVALWAIAKAGGTFVVIHPILKESSVRHILNDCSMAGLIASGPKLKKLMLGEFHSLTFCICTDSQSISFSQTTALADLTEMELNSKENLEVNIKEEDLVSIIYTSGSTGMPKGVMLTHKNVTLGAHAVSQYLKINYLDRILSLLPFSFDYGLNQMTTAVKEGASLVLKNYIFPEEIIEIIESEKITGLAGIPTIWIQLLLAKNIEKYSMDHFRYITNSGDRLAASHVKALQKAFPKTQIYLMYGLTEAFRATYLDPTELSRRPDSIGKAIPYAEIFVIDSNGHETAPNEIGELVQAGPLVSKGYWGNLEETKQKMRPHPLKNNGEIVCYSGDFVKRDAEGFIYYVGRNSSMIKCLGHRISPSEIESELYKNPAIKQAVAFGVKDEILGEKIKVVLTLKTPPALDEKTILDYCKKFMPHYMVPKQIIITEQLPTTSSGKLDRPAIASTYAA